MRNTVIAALIVILLGSGAAGSSMYLRGKPFPFARPFPAQTTQRKLDFQTRKIVFDSNRSGTFGIYTLDPASGEIEELADSRHHEMYPDPHPAGNLIVYARAWDLKEQRSQIWLMNRDGSNKRLLIQKGTFPSFSADGKTVYFERAKRKVMAVALDGSNVRKIFPPDDSEFRGKLIVKPRISEDGRFVTFTSNRPNHWHAWLAPLDGGKATHIHRGCEPSWVPGSNTLVFVKRHAAKALAGIYQYHQLTGKTSAFEDREDPFGHEYFPTLTGPGGMLLFAACPGNEHYHETANYQLFARVGDSERMQLTHDAFTNRWPRFLPTLQ